MHGVLSGRGLWSAGIGRSRFVGQFGISQDAISQEAESVGTVRKHSQEAQSGSRVRDGGAVRVKALLAGIRIPEPYLSFIKLIVCAPTDEALPLGCLR